MDEAIHDIEEAFVAHWSHMGRWARGTLRDDNGALRFETPIAHLPYNGVIRSRLNGDADRTIADILASFRRRGVNCMWVVHPTAEPRDLPERLAAHGLAMVEKVTGMALDVKGWAGPGPHPGIGFERVEDEEGLRAYEDLNVAYWELPEEERGLVDELIRFWLGKAPVHRWLARLEGKPVGKGLLSRAAPPGVAAIYGMSVRPEARRRGIAGGLTAAMVAQARDLGCTRIVLHASEDGAPVYRRVGFVEHCEFQVFATAPLWSVHDHSQ